MKYPTIELITRNVLTTLQAVRRPAYNVDLLPTRKIKRGVVPDDMTCFVVQESPDKVGDDGESEALGLIGFRQHYTFETWIINSENSEQPIDERINLARSDIEKALMADPTRGGLAIDTTIETPELFDDVKGAFAGIRVRASVYYRTLIDDPYSNQPE